MIAMQYGSGNAQKSGARVDLLWSNSDPTSNFAAQTIDCDLSGYRFVSVLCNFGSASGNQYNVAMQTFPVDETNKYLMISADNNRGGERRFTYSIANKTITFASATYNSSTNNAYIIPIGIYGIKV